MKLKKYRSWILCTLIVASVIGFAVLGAREPEGVVKLSSMGNKHLDSINQQHEPYNSNPPTSGPHVGTITQWGINKEIIPDEIQIHNLEDGGVIVQYNPDKLPKEEWARLEEVVMGTNRKRVIIAPRYNMDAPIVLTAWTRLMSLESIDQDKIKEFIIRYEGKDHH